MKFFQFFTCKEFFPNCSETEIALCIKSGLFDNLLTLFQVLDNLRDFLGRSIIVNSTYRSYEHNVRVGGSPTSQHLSASAIDFTCSSIPFETLVFLVVEFLHKSAMEKFVGQVIFYHKRKFIHISLRTPAIPFQIKNYEQGDN